MGAKSETVLEGNIQAVAGFSDNKKRCPECGREVDNGFCAVHAEVEPVDDFNLTVKIDGRKVKLNEEKFEKLTGFTPGKIEALPQNEKLKLLKKKLEGTRVRVLGRNGSEKFFPDEIDVLSET